MYMCIPDCFPASQIALLLCSLGDSGEADSFFDLSGEVINEIAPQPHLLAGPTATTTLSATASNTNSNRESRGGFPQLDSNLLQVQQCSNY